MYCLRWGWAYCIESVCSNQAQGREWLLLWLSSLSDAGHPLLEDYTPEPLLNLEYPMNKSELIAAIAESTDLPKTTATAVVDAFTQSVTSALQNGDSVSLVGFGTFEVKQRAAREGRNPKTGAPLQIPASKLPSFKPGKTLKDAVN